MGKVCLVRFAAAAMFAVGGTTVLLAQVTVPALSAAEVMLKVAANQDSAEQDRASYVYVQHARVISRKGDKVMCEEVTDSRVTPKASGSEQHLLSLDGRLLVKGKYVHYKVPPGGKESEKLEKSGDDDLNIGTGDDDSDRDLVENMRRHMVNDTSKDGVGAGLFPLTSKSQSDYTFRLIGRQKMNGRDVYHLEFQPRDKTDYAWKGQAYIDVDSFQPVAVQTTLSRKIPMAVRMLLGTNVPGLGFSVVYAPQKDGLWFPASFGTEFKIHVLFFFRREIVIAAENRDFEKTHVKARVIDPNTGGEVQREPEPTSPK